MRELWPTMAAPTVEPMASSPAMVSLTPGTDGASGVTGGSVDSASDGPLKIVTLEDLQRSADAATTSARADGGDRTDGESPTGETTEGDHDG